MALSNLLSPQAVIPALRANSKKQAILEIAARAAAVTGRAEREIFETFIQREKLGSTGVGHGIAIPHGRLARLPAFVGLFARLERPIEFDAVDDEPVDIVFALLAPEGAGADHLKALASVARVLRDTAIIQKLRASSDPAALYAVLTHPPTSNAA
jgi:PTS system nitrogen regulatory IIA component